MNRATAQNVAAICDRLVADGANPAKISSHDVRDALGFGSFTTIVKYIKAWTPPQAPIVGGTPPSVPAATKPNLDAATPGVQLPAEATAPAAEAGGLHSLDQLEFDLASERKTEQKKNVDYFIGNLGRFGSLQPG